MRAVRSTCSTSMTWDTHQSAAGVRGGTTDTTVSTLTGRFTVVDPAPLTSNTAIDVSTGPANDNADTRGVIAVGVTITCSVPAAVTHGKPFSVSCATPGLAYGRVAAGKVTFTTTLYRLRTLTLDATTATTRTFVASRSPSYPLRVV